MKNRQVSKNQTDKTVKPKEKTNETNFQSKIESLANLSEVLLHELMEIKMNLKEVNANYNEP